MLMPPSDPHVPVRVFVSDLVLLQFKVSQESLATVGIWTGVGLEQIGQSYTQKVGYERTSPMVCGWV